MERIVLLLCLSSTFLLNSCSKRIVEVKALLSSEEKAEPIQLNKKLSGEIVIGFDERSAGSVHLKGKVLLSDVGQGSTSNFLMQGQVTQQR